MSEEAREVKCYTYKVEMVIHIFAEDEAIASNKLDKEGGYISSRKTALLDAVTVSIDSTDTTETETE